MGAAAKATKKAVKKVTSTKTKHTSKKLKKAEKKIVKAEKKAKLKKEAKSKPCHMGSLKGFSEYAWDPDGRYCYKVKFGHYVQQDWSRQKSKCNKAGFHSNVYIGRFGGNDHKYPNGDSRSCPGGKKRSVSI